MTVNFAVKWVLVTMLGLGTLGAINAVGKPRKPLTGEKVAWVTFVNGVYMVAIIVFWETS